MLCANLLSSLSLTLLLPSGMGRELEKKKENEVELIGWDKKYFVRQKKKSEIIVMLIIHLGCSKSNATYLFSQKLE